MGYQLSSKSKVLGRALELLESPSLTWQELGATSVVTVVMYGSPLARKTSKSKGLCENAFHASFPAAGPKEISLAL